MKQMSKEFSPDLPCFKKGRTQKIDTIVIHSMWPHLLKTPSLLKALAYTKKNCPLSVLKSIFTLRAYSVSAHYIIHFDGTIFQLLNDSDTAFHAGKSIMPEPDNRENVNDFSVGIEVLANAKNRYYKKQYITLASLCKKIVKKNHIKCVKIVGHSDISGKRAVKLKLREEPKIDPSPYFDWNYFLNLLEIPYEKF